MSRTRDPLARLLRRLRRRMLLLRAAEAAGLGLLAASGLAAALMGVLIYHDRPALGVLTVIIPLGIGGGLAHAWSRRPSIVAAAIEADRQLHLNELLSTAWALRAAGREDALVRAVLWAADDAAGHIAPAQVVLHRLGMRAWGGIGLMAALAITLGLISANPLSTSASPHLRSAAGALAQRHVDPAADQSSAAAASRAGADLPDHAGQSDEVLDSSAQPGSPTARGEAPDSGQSPGNLEGAGGGSGTSAESGATRTLPPAASDTQRHTGMDGATAAGGTAARRGDGGQEGRSGSAAAGAGASRPPPWNSANWSDAARRADLAIRSDRIPAEYHDLIRDYFER